MPTLEELLPLAIEQVSETPLPNNPTTTYGNVLNSDELSVAAIKASPQLEAMYRELKGNEAVDTLFNQFDNETVPQIINPYNIAPLNIPDSEAFPGYAAALARWEENEDEAQKAMKERMMLRGNYPASVLEVSPPKKPFGYDKAKDALARGFNPFEEVNVDGINAFRIGINFGGPRKQTPDQLNYAKDFFGLSPSQRRENPELRGVYSDKLPGRFAYINPEDPNSLIAYFEEGKSPVMWDSPLVDMGDVGEFVLQEGPVIGAELFIGLKGLNRFDDFLKKFPDADIGVAKKVLESVTGNIILAGGAAGANLLQRLYGSARGAHNMSALEMLNDSKWIFLLAGAGNQAIETFMNGFPKLYRALSGKDVSASEIKQIEEAIKRARGSEQGTKARTLAGKDEDITLLDINETIAELSKLAKEGDKELLKGGFNPTTAQASKDARMADIEKLLIENANNPAYAEFYDKLMAGNEKVIQAFFRTLFQDLQEDVTGQTVGKSITNLFNDNADMFAAEGELVIKELFDSIDNIKTSTKEGAVPLDKVIDEKASTSLITRTTSRLNDISREYQQMLSETVIKAIDDVPELANLKFSGRKIRKSIKEFQNAGENPEALSNLGSKQIKKAYYDTFTKESTERLLRYSKGDLTLPEVNALRVELNSFINKIDPSKSLADRRIFGYAINIKNAIEEQMEFIIKKNAPSKQVAEDILDVFNAQKSGLELANNQAVKNLIKQEPETMVSYLLSLGKKGDENIKVRDIMQFLKRTDSQPEINGIRNQVIEYVQRNFLDLTDKTADQAAKEYRKFMIENKHTLKEIFPEEQFSQIFKSVKNFDDSVIKPLAAIQRKQTLLENRFGDGNPFNIVTQILDTGAGTKSSGQLIDDLDFIDDLLAAASPKERIILQKQISDATKKYIVSRSTVDGIVDSRKIGEFMNEGFGPSEIVGKDLSFEGVIGRLLGEGGDDFIKNLNVLRDMSMRISTDLTTTSAARRQIAEELVDPKINYLKRFFIPPLTQFGRRVTAAEKLIGERNLAFVGELMRDPQLFQSYVDVIRGRKNVNSFIKLLNTHNTTATTEVARILESYDKEEKTVNKSEQLPSVGERISAPYLGDVGYDVYKEIRDTYGN